MYRGNTKPLLAADWPKASCLSVTRTAQRQGERETNISKRVLSEAKRDEINDPGLLCPGVLVFFLCVLILVSGVLGKNAAILRGIQYFVSMS